MNSHIEEVEVIEKANNLYDLKRYQQALETILSLGREPSILLRDTYNYVYVFSLLNLDRILEANEFCLNQLGQDPNNPYLLYYLSIIYENRGKIKKAHSCIEKAVELDPENELFHSQVADILLQLGQKKAAHKHLEIAEEINPQSEKVIQSRAIAYLMDKKYGQAEATIYRGLELYPNSNKFLHLLTQIGTKSSYQTRKLKDMALNALEQNPTDEVARNNLLTTLKISHPLARFFVSKGFNRYTIEWNIWRVLLMIIAWKGVLLWGGIAIIYLLVTWLGTACFYSITRLHPRYKLILQRNQVQMSNAFLILLGLSICTLVSLNWTTIDGESWFGLIAFIMFFILLAISYFEIESRKGKIHFAIYSVISTYFIFFNFGDMLSLGIKSIFFLLVYAFIFTLNITFK